MKVYLVRHGQSEANLTDSMSLSTVPLTEKGKKDAEMAGRLIKNLKFDAVLTSPYTRAMQTQQIAMPGIEATVVDLIHEFACGVLEGHTYEELFKIYGDKLRHEIDVDDFSDYGGESYAGVRQRTRDFMAYCESLNAEKIVAFSHAGFILTMFDEITGRAGKPGRNVSCHNGSVTVFECRNGNWTVNALNLTENVLK